jgi:hypothetical protein
MVLTETGNYFTNGSESRELASLIALIIKPAFDNPRSAAELVTTYISEAPRYTDIFKFIINRFVFQLIIINFN